MNSIAIYPRIVCLALIYCIYCCIQTLGSNIDTEFPLIFKPTFGQNDENYFGLTVEMQSIRNKTNFIIGAPKTQSTLYNAKHTGTVFKCWIQYNLSTICDEINLDFRRIAASNRRSSPLTADQMARDDMFLGGTVVADPKSSRVAVCGHKWWQELHANRPQHQRNPSGSCFIVDLEKPNDTPFGIFPLRDPNLQIQHNTYYYSHSMSGFSAAFTHNSDSLLMGSPGFYQWRGTLLETEPINMGVNGLLKEKAIFHQRLTASEAYVGYSLASGHFLSGSQYSLAIGAPRDANFKGKVYIYNMWSNHFFDDIGGTQMGEYFGYSLLSVNVNNDEFSDLIVGAPFYSNKYSYDCGRVYVYLSSGNGFDKLKPQILSGSDTSGSRFGTSIANLGDINFDGYNEIAVGAPYEDDHGAVYVYSGSKYGLLPKYLQRISANEHLNQFNLMGFGISIAGKRDVDNNHYNDLLIGSYLTNKAVLLRTKPIVNIMAEIRLNASHINVNERNCLYLDPISGMGRHRPCVGAKYCIQYEGTHVPSSLNLNISIQLDSRRPESTRCFTVYKNQIKFAITKILTISAYSTESCSDEFTVYLKDRSLVDDIFTPIQLSLSYSLIQLQTKGTFCPKCPIIKDTKLITNQIHFQTGCRIDEKCVSKLQISTKTLLNSVLSMKTDPILEGYHKSLTLVTNVDNSGEPSYLTKLLITTNPKLQLIKQDSRCRLPNYNTNNQTDGYLLECEVGNPLKSHKQQEISIPLDISKLDLDINEIEVTIELKSASEVTKDSVLNETFTIQVVRNASLLMIGHPLESELIYEKESKRKQDFIQFSAAFQLIKQHWSSVGNVFIEINFPGLFNKQPFLYRPVVELSGGVSVNCNRTVLELPMIPMTRNADKSTDIDSQRNRRDNSGQKQISTDKRTLQLECNSRIECVKMECFAGPFTSDKQMAKFFVHSALNIKTIESIFGKKYDTIKLRVQSKAIISDSRIVSKVEQISTDFVFKRIDLKPEPIAKWIIFVSIAVGLFGFFRRTKPQTEDTNEWVTPNSDDQQIERNSLLEVQELNDNDFGDQIQHINSSNQTNGLKS
ncbi:unnamed protein product [Medioppia subpectinata]|uniref:Uncharacterized protein n=1 Tax=Medioppia subpectinata TaxID=1979941 RepID=A0A7R9KLU6_9ACAR|nr:unnamed protein product [Medioppia subpectinata]CAG2105990.1 unnamed protein product [Medioppia subpectinata]